MNLFKNEQVQPRWAGLVADRPWTDRLRNRSRLKCFREDFFQRVARLIRNCLI